MLLFFLNMSLIGTYESNKCSKKECIKIKKVNQRIIVEKKMFQTIKLIQK